MLIYDKVEIGNKLLSYRKEAGLTQFEIAEASDISQRAYANIERGEANMRVDTALKICKVLNITPNDLFVDTSDHINHQSKQIFEWLDKCTFHERETALALVAVYMNRHSN